MRRNTERGAAYGLCQIYSNEPWHYELRPDAIEHGCPRLYADPTHGGRFSWINWDHSLALQAAVYAWPLYEMRRMRAATAVRKANRSPRGPAAAPAKK